MEENTYLTHHGIKGQKWGVRRFQNADGSLTAAGAKRYSTLEGTPKELERISRETLKDARKDAKETAEAKMFYGDGAGTRRKRIKQVVEQKSKDPDYKKAYDYYLERQDMQKAADKTKAQRKALDTKEAISKGIPRVIRSVASLTATAATIYALAHQTGVDKIVSDYANVAISKLKS